MHRCLSFIVQILLLMSKDVLSKEECPKGLISNCGDCIKSGPFCVWCKQLNFTQKGESDAVRCDTRATLQERGCQQDNIISPKSVIEIVRDLPLTKATSTREEPVQMKPQEVRLRLRPGQPYTFPLHFKRAEDYPVDLYYLMDLSYSMKDDLENVKNLGKDLLKTLRKITSRARIGFGSFVDKTVLPFTNTNPQKLKKPCPETEGFCQPAFGYRHVLSLTDNQNLFNERVSAQGISGNLDSPEGGLDAIMQTAVCGERIGWGNSTRLLVFTTDAGFHMAGDGKLGAILEPNDGDCHLDSNHLYSKSNEMDYPSVSQLAEKLAENNIQPIFAVTKNMESVYTKLKELIPKSEVGVLSKDSSNVVTLIENAYKSLSSNVIVTHGDLPDHVTVTYTSDCQSGERSGTTGICNNVGIGQEVIFHVTVTVDQCVDSKSFLIGPLGFTEKMKVTVDTHCECHCNDSGERPHPFCNGKGSVTCGICRCNEGSVGQRCECQVGDKDEAHLKAACRKDNSTCSGLGECICGVCHCHASEDGRKIYGTHCECDDRSCEVDQNKLCGGNGRCDCGKCTCNPGYEGSACQCKKSNEGCYMGSKSVCNGRGKCVCNVCQCVEGYTLPFCESCPGCPSPCPKSASCIECLGFGSGPYSKNCSESCPHIKHTMVDNLNSDKFCREKDSQNCWMFFIMNELDGINNYEVSIRNERECPQPPNIIAIVAGTLAGVALIGLLMLLLIKGLLYMKDLKEFRRFENEKQRAKWSKAENPLFKTATTTVQNPYFSGE